MTGRGWMRRLLLGALCATLGLLGASGTAAAKVTDMYVYSGNYPAGTFNGSDAVGASAFGEPANIAVDDSSGDVYVGAYEWVYHFDSTGTSKAFSALAPNTVIEQPTYYSLGSLKVDNSGTATQGRIYGKTEYGNLGGYLPSGAPIGGAFPLENLGDACAMDVAPDGGIWIEQYYSPIQRYSPSGTLSGEEIPISNPMCAFAIDSQENFYVPQVDGSVSKYSRSGELLDSTWIDPGMGSENLAIDRSDDHVFAALAKHVNEFGPDGELIQSFGFPESLKSYGGLGGAEGIAVNSSTHKVYVGDVFGSGKVDSFVKTGTVTIPDATTQAPVFTPTSATLHGLVDPDTAHGGTEIIGCRFEWGTTDEYDHTVPCDQPTPIGGSTPVTATITGLTQSQVYHFRVVAYSANEIQSNGADISFQASGPPLLSDESASEVFSDGGRLNAKIDPNGSPTTYHFEWGPEPCSASACSSIPSPDDPLKKPTGLFSVTQVITGLSPGQTYYWRIVATNGNETVPGPDRTFTTFALETPTIDTCENALVRRQTSASLLPECRAYELVSAADTGGYDVESSLVAGQHPLAGYPGASNPERVLYTVHFGAIPGVGDPPNYGDDPYIATRGPDGWTTEYVGVPVGATPDLSAFGSTLTGADEGLGTMAFGGQSICAPCFEDGTTGIPIRLPDGRLVQGMQGSEPVDDPQPAGEVRKQFSADGSHFVFGSEDRFEPAGNSGSVSIYDRNLSGGTQVVSTMPDGTTMSGEVAELDVSANGGRVLIGRSVGTDAAGNGRYDLFMHIGTDPHSVAVADTPGGVIYDGMTADGTKVYFTTEDALAGDGDSSADLFRADVGSSSAVVTRVSTGSGGSGDTNACTPTDDWNSLEGGSDCGVLGIAGGGGVARGDGTVYFLSPELLDGPSNGVVGEPNLFVARPGGSPEFVATLAADDPLVQHAASDAASRHTEDFQLTPSGDVAAFGTRVPATGYATNGHLAVYRYDEPGNSLDCASCASTGARAESDAVLPHEGGGLTDDGRVFFTSGDPLNLRDLNGGKTDVYEWQAGGPTLISTGTSEFDSALLNVSRDGRDVTFFTHDRLVAADHNGNLVKIYDARAGGGFYVQLAEPPCRASDECHGPGTVAPPPPDIGTYKGEGGQAGTHSRKPRCRGKRVRRHGSCVKRRRHRRHHSKHRKASRRHG